MFLPTTPEEVKLRKWNSKPLDIILVSGDTYIDSPQSGVALIGQLLVARGFRVGIIAQPRIDSAEDILRLGEPRLFWGISSGVVDSMVANYTATLKRRHQDDFTPGGENRKRPDRALLAYTNLIRRYRTQKSVPIVLGGIEASLRRVAHYDYWSNSLRRSILLDAKADYLLYGMAEAATVELAKVLSAGGDPLTIRGLSYLTNQRPQLTQEQANWRQVELPSFEMISADPDYFAKMFLQWSAESEKSDAQILQQHEKRWVVHNPPSLPLPQAEFDAIYALPFEREVHPFYAQMGSVRALDTIRFSVTTHRGCYGRCSFCAITLLQGAAIQSRSVESIVQEIRTLTQHPRFTGVILNVGGPTANMYGHKCRRNRPCECSSQCLTPPRACAQLESSHAPILELLQQIEQVPGVRKVHITSGIRFDLIMADKSGGGAAFLERMVERHTSGQMKIAPEHVNADVLRLMNKSNQALEPFLQTFEQLNQPQSGKQFLTFYLLLGHPGETEQSLQELKNYLRRRLKIVPEQVQIFTPTPSTYSTLLYYLEKDPLTGQTIPVIKDLKEKNRIRDLFTETRNQLRR